MRIAIIGAGGVGGLLTGLLARSGATVSLVARGRHLAAVRADGLRIESEAFGSFVARPEIVTDDAARAGPADVVLVAVKSWQLAQTAPSLPALLAPAGLAIPLQNGIDASQVLAAAVGAERVCGGVCFCISHVEAPGLVRHSGGPPRLVFGEWGAGRHAESLSRLCDLLRAAQIGAAVVPDIQAALWEKLLFVGPFGLVGAMSRAPAGVVRSSPELRNVLRDAMREVAAIANAEGVAVSDNAVEAALKRMDALPPQAISSLHRDIVAGQPSELDALAGAVVRAARRLQTSAPLHELFWACLSPQERDARSKVVS